MWTKKPKPFLNETLKSVEGFNIDMGSIPMVSIKITAMVLFLDNDQLLRYALRSIEPFVDEIALFRGKYKTFPDPKGIYRKVKLYQDEEEFRNYALSQIEDGNYVIVADSDEIWFGNWEFTRELLNNHQPRVAIVKQQCLSGRILYRPRIYQKTKSTQYKRNHCILMDGDKYIFGTGSRPPKFRLPLSFLHIPQLRNQYYKDQNWIHYETREEKCGVAPPSVRWKGKSNIWKEHQSNIETLIKEACK